MQDIKFTFDSVSNIKRIKDSVLAIGTLGGGYDNTFNYDGLHRLEGSQGINTLGHYRYTMDYTSSGRITNKYLETPSSSLTGPTDMFYGYCNDQKPHTVRRIFDEKNEKHFDLRWDDAGNLGQISIGNEDAKFETGRFLFWTEDCYGCEHRLCLSNVVSNRMHPAVDEKYSSYYVYDHSGERRESRDQSQACLSYAETKQSVRSDHLGSASWITVNGGFAVQHLQYLPYGERYVDQRISGYSERFTFTGKERDCETGFSYFGAMYYDGDLSGLFLSANPMADKYSSVSPYVYCAWNPVKLVDPDGRDISYYSI